MVGWRPLFWTPNPVVALPCGSRSTRRVGRSARASPAARLTAVVVLPTPPFWFTIARVLATRMFHDAQRSIGANVPRRTQHYQHVFTTWAVFHAQHFPQSSVLSQIFR